MNNPLLEISGLPPFSKINPADVEPAIDITLENNRKRINELVTTTEYYNWDNFIQPLEDLEDNLNRIWSTVNHMNSVVNSEELRAAYNACLPKLSEYSTELGQHEGIYRAVQSIAQSPEFQHFDKAQTRVIENQLSYKVKVNDEQAM